MEQGSQSSNSLENLLNGYADSNCDDENFCPEENQDLQSVIKLLAKMDPDRVERIARDVLSLCASAREPTKNMEEQIVNVRPSRRNQRRKFASRKSIQQYILNKLSNKAVEELDLMKNNPEQKRDDIKSDMREVLGEISKVHLPISPSPISFEGIKQVVSEDSPLFTALNRYYPQFCNIDDEHVKSQDLIKQCRANYDGFLVGQAIYEDSTVRHLLGEKYNAQLRVIKSAITAPFGAVRKKEAYRFVKHATNSYLLASSTGMYALFIPKVLPPSRIEKASNKEGGDIHKYSVYFEEIFDDNYRHLNICNGRLVDNTKEHRVRELSDDTADHRVQKRRLIENAVEEDEDEEVDEEYTDLMET